jgi:Ca-activated chloride channel family protein
VKLVQPLWLLGTVFAVLLGVALVVGSYRLLRAKALFADEERMSALATFDPSVRRTIKGVLLVLSAALAFVALARPQYRIGHRRIPATNLDVIVVLDFSKSMYARDVSPSRIARAKAEVNRLTRELSGARFGAVAFAGEPMGFPLTSDGGAVSTFLRQLDPNDMPVGGTAIARALEKAREIYARDPKAKEHKKVVLLVTDGEDLEGDPVEAARLLATEGVTVNVVQIGGLTPERIPEVGPDGRVVGYRTDERGKPLTTALSPEGEAQLGKVAEAGGGKIIRAEKGTTGIEQITAYLRTLMKEELAERAESVYDDQFGWFVGAALLLLLGDTFVSDAPRRRRAVVPPRPVKKRFGAGKKEETADA